MPPRHERPRPGTAGAKDDGAEISARVTRSRSAAGPLSEAEEICLARAFLEETRTDPRPWPEVFKSWEPALELTVAEQHAVRVRILRERIFGAAALGAARARRRRGRP